MDASVGTVQMFMRSNEQRFVFVAMYSLTNQGELLSCCGGTAWAILVWEGSRRRVLPYTNLVL